MGFNFTGFLQGIDGASKIMNMYHGIRDREDQRIKDKEEREFRDKKWAYQVEQDKISNALKYKNIALQERRIEADIANQRRNYALGYAKYRFDIKKYNDEQSQAAASLQLTRDYMKQYLDFNDDESDQLAGIINELNMSGKFVINPETNAVIGSAYNQDGAAALHGTALNKGSDGIDYATPIAITRDPESGRPSISEIGKPLPKDVALQQYDAQAQKLGEEGEALLKEQQAQEQPKTLTSGLDKYINKELISKAQENAKADLKAIQTDIRVNKLSNRIPLTAAEQKILNGEDSTLMEELTNKNIHKLARGAARTENTMKAMDKQALYGTEIPQTQQVAKNEQPVSTPEEKSPALDNVQQSALGRLISTPEPVQARQSPEYRMPRMSKEEAQKRLDMLVNVATDKNIPSDIRKDAMEKIEALKTLGANYTGNLDEGVEIVNNQKAQNDAIRKSENEAIAKDRGLQVADAAMTSRAPTNKEENEFIKDLSGQFSTGNKEGQLRKENVQIAATAALGYFKATRNVTNAMLNDEKFKASFVPLVNYLAKHPELDPVMAEAWLIKNGGHAKENPDELKLVTNAISNGYGILSSYRINNHEARAVLSHAASVDVVDKYGGDFDKYYQTALENQIKKAFSSTQGR